MTAKTAATLGEGGIVTQACRRRAAAAELQQRDFHHPPCPRHATNPEPASLLGEQAPQGPQPGLVLLPVLLGQRGNLPRGLACAARRGRAREAKQLGMHGLWHLAGLEPRIERLKALADANVLPARLSREQLAQVTPQLFWASAGIGSEASAASWQASHRMLGGAERRGQSRHWPLPKALGAPQTLPVRGSRDAYFAKPPPALLTSERSGIGASGTSNTASGLGTSGSAASPANVGRDGVSSVGSLALGHAWAAAAWDAGMALSTAKKGLASTAGPAGST
eukprot:CAMPEP_0168450998 /NCGR_PEP_ID=MMETSP0228-20121227/48411_1 /TAXON_ID=133427 /ORGANISM="Protoceratium reticulatum, Strain CCCM 535 (=CCMP 1889)" /LENGTH=279 /DNA_ID=CAMNT_0008465605 /DNA_START=212 /DNA_END=1052 /DNA_ORIENTATION=+